QQIAALRANRNIQGSAFYSANSFQKNFYGLNQTMQTQWYPYPALLPAMPWLPHQPLPTPVLSMQTGRDGAHKLQWTAAHSKQDLQFAVYRYEPAAGNRSKTLIGVTREQHFDDPAAPDKKYRYMVSSLDRLHNESEMSNAVE
ncbi:MAG: hypothetical protein IT257_11995, partial [Chitinophagaceae bacterium]|nr:hypothetical protein [Chitinophagaceae bacterium]